MYQKSILYALFLSLFISIALAPAFAALEFESGPLQEKALDEREQEDQHTQDIWTYAIVIVVVLLIIRLGFRIMKKRRQKKP